MSWLLIILVILVVSIDLLLIMLFRFHFKEYPLISRAEHSKISILLPAKDEAHNLSRCLDSLLALSYPTDQLEILIGNDNSDDNTLEIANSYATKHDHVSVHNIEGRLGEQQGKGNALAHLAQKASGNYYLFTDADMTLPTEWVEHMLAAMSAKDTGLAIGVTQVAGSQMQNTDWLTALAMVKVMTDLGRPVTGVGNNMIVSSEAYESVGGYETMAFSVVEDYELFKHITAKGYECKHVFSKDVLGTTQAAIGLGNLLNQRKRWMWGAEQLSWQMLLLLALQPSVYLGILGVLYLNPKIGLILLGAKLLVKHVFISSVRHKLRLQFRLFTPIIFEVYHVVLTLLTSVYYVLPIRVKWKGRTY